MSTAKDSNKVFTLQRESTPMTNVIEGWLVVPLFCASQLCYADHAARAIEVIQELTFHIPPAINGLKG